MRGYPEYNFPAFYEAEASLEKRGCVVINPARIDEVKGFTVDTPEHTLTGDDLKAFIKRDIDLVMSVDAIVVLPGWEKSKGVAVEVALARYCDIGVYSYPILNRI